MLGCVGSSRAVTPAGSVAVAVDNSNNLVFLKTDVSGNLLTTGGGGGGGGTSSTFSAAFPATGTALGVKDSAATNMTFLKATAANALVVDGSAVTQPVSGTFWQATQPVSGTFWQATQPVSGTVTANAGTGTFAISAAALPLPTGAATETSLAKLPVAQASTTSGQSGPLVQGAVTTAAPSYTTAQTSPLSLTTAGALREDQASIAGTAIDVNSGNKSAGTQRIVIATDQPNLTTPLNVALAANQSVNAAQINAVTPLMGNGTTGTGSLRVTIASDNSAVAGLGGGSVGSAVPANAELAGVKTATANPTNATAGNLTAIMGDKAGRIVVTEANVRELIGNTQTNVATTSETTIVAAGGAGVFDDISSIIVTTAGAAAQTITIKDATAGTTRMVLNYPNAAVAPGQPLQLNFNPPLTQASANATWTVTQSAATACNYTVVFVKNL